VAGDDACLVIRSGGGRGGETYALRGDRVAIGRHPDAAIFLDDVTVSRNHAVVVREGDSWVIVDEGSLNGTYVNRRRGDRTVLADGDEIQIGKYKLTFIVPS
jgi:pSer/pThr/pTyr-binding forkhead associated (FHA) protein